MRGARNYENEFEDLMWHDFVQIASKDVVYLDIWRGCWDISRIPSRAEGSRCGANCGK